MTINALFQQTVARDGARVALRWREKKTWRQMSYRELAENVENMASALYASGVRNGDRVAILSENQPAWVITDLATLSLGAIVVPIYPSLPAPQVAYILNNSGAKVLLAGDRKQYAKAQIAQKDAPNLSQLLVVDDEESDETSFAAFVNGGAAKPLGEQYSVLRDAVNDDDVASLVYTSGTTGDPKGAMLTHHNFASNVAAAQELLSRYDAAQITSDDVFLSFLPLSHVFERMAGYYLALGSGAAIAYTELRTLMPDMADVKPTLMVNVPRVWEAMQDRILDKVEKSPENRRRLFHKALEVGKRVSIARNNGESPAFFDAISWIFYEKLVFSKVRETFGGQFRLLVSGGAALNANTASFFHAIGFNLLEGYGMTESAPVIAVNPPGRARIGTVGKVLPGGVVKIEPDGEICYQGPNVMKGYWENPKATGEVIDADSWLHTGDIGALDADGYLKITDRKKDIIVLANGKNVAPQPIESALKQSPFLSEVVLIGDKQSVVTALVIPNKDKFTEWAKGEGLPADDYEALCQNPAAKKKLKAEIDARSGALAEFERVKRFAVLSTPFSIDSGELTPSLKVKRKVVLQKFAPIVAELSGEDLS